MYVAVIGIDRYRVWGRLHNAVRDAEGARDAFVALGFTSVGPALFNEAATGAALRRLVTDDLRALGTSDSLVLFFAGHGHTATMPYPDGTVTKTGYLIPADADLPAGSVATWLNLDGWLHEVAHLPARHILVILDACHSGVALNPVIRWRGRDARLADPVERLRARRSRRIITSALDDQLAMDSGPLHGHSLFTGCLIEALTGGIAAKTGQSVLTGSQIGLHVQERVTTYPSSQQTPDFGALELDNRGELVIELPHAPEPGGHERRQPSGPHEIWSTNPRSRPTSNRVAEVVRHTPPAGVDAIRSKRVVAPPATSAQSTTIATSASPASLANASPAQPSAAEPASTVAVSPNAASRAPEPTSGPADEMPSVSQAVAPRDPLRRPNDPHG